MQKKYIKLSLQFRRNKSYHGKRTAHWCFAPCLLFKPFKQRLVDVISFRHSKSLVFEPFFLIALITLVLYFEVFWFVEFRRPPFSPHVSFFSPILYFSNLFNFFFDAQKPFVGECSHVITVSFSS
jgi:hypothetical protein